MNESNLSQTPGFKSERFAMCSVVAGVVGMLCACCCFPSGIVCAAVGIVCAILSKQRDERAKKAFTGTAITGIVLCVIAALLTFAMCYMIILYYEILAHPENWPPYVSDAIERSRAIMEQMEKIYNP